MNKVSGTGWFAAPNAVFDQGLSSSEILVLLYLKRCAGPDGCAWPGQANIAKACRLSERTVRDTVLKLKDGGFLEVEGRVSENGSRTSNLYKLSDRQISTPPANETPPPGKLAPTPPANETVEEDPYEKDQLKESPLNPPRGKKPSASLPPIPADLYPLKTALENFIEHRKEIKKPMTGRALEIVYGKCRKWGFARSLQSIEDAIASGYQGLFEPRRVLDIVSPQLTREERRRLTS